jgi:pimeloyl-ACP methyl ester carboxylesterase
VDRIRIGHLEFKCTSVGETGPLIVLLHGFGGGPLDWHHTIPGLSANHRLLIPNLTPLFSSVHPISFTQQVEYLGNLISHINQQGEPFVIVGSSFGGTLSWGIRSKFQNLVQAHVMVNPMPLEPLPLLKSAQLRVLFGLNMVPGALPLFLKTRKGRELLLELGSVFGFGAEGRRGLEGGLSERKLTLVSKAVQRFAWITQAEDWAHWKKQLMDHMIPLLLITGSDDPLFIEKDFRSYQNLVPMSEHMPVTSANHMLVKTHGDLLAQTIAKFVKSLAADSSITVSTLRHAI